jgi:hypothetical protein
MNPIDKVITNNSVIKNFSEIFRDETITAIEQSVKITKENVIYDRVLFMIETSNISYVKMEKIAKILKIPHDEILDEYYRSDGVGFGIQVDDDEINYRIYFEKGILQTEIPKLAREKIRTKKTITSLKWNPNEPKDFNNTDYYRILTNTTLLDINNAAEKACFYHSPKFAKDAFKKNKKVFLYETTDTNSERKSFYINIDDLYLNDVRQDVVNFSSEKIFDSLKIFEEFKINYFSAGVDKNNKKFMTVYFLTYDKDEVE